MMKKTMLSLFIGLFLFSCSDLKTLSEDVKKVKQDQSLIIQKLNSLEKKIADVAKAPPVTTTLEPLPVVIVSEPAEP